MSVWMGLFILALGGMALGAISVMANAISKRGASASELAELKLQLEQITRELDNARATSDEQTAQLAELQERVDFAERMLTEARQPRSLGSGRERE